MPTQEAEDEVNRNMQQVDTDGSGFIDFTEFITAILDRKKYFRRRKSKLLSGLLIRMEVGAFRVGNSKIC